MSKLLIRSEIVSHTMKRQELIHVHALLFELRVHLQTEERLPSDAFSAYDRQRIRPHHIHHGKEAHRRAIVLLLNGFRQTVEARPDEHAPHQ